MIFGRKPNNKNTKREWKLAGAEIGETQSYKYLGIDLVSGLNFKKVKERMITKARKRMQVWAMGMRGGELVEDCRRVWEALVRPILEYGAVVWGEVKWEEAEQLQREMGKMILGCSSKMTNEVVLGELGWWTMKVAGRLRFWARIVGGISRKRRLVARA